MFDAGQEEGWSEPDPRLSPAPAPETERDSDLADGSHRRLDPRSLQLERLSAILALLILGPASLGALALFLIFDVVVGPWRAVAAAVWLLFAAWLLWSATLYPRLEYERASWALSPRGMEIRRGVFWRHVIDVPRSRVQHTDVAQGPLARRFGLATLSIHTAGTTHHTVTLGGLDRATALRVRDHLVRGGRGDGV